MFLQIEVLGSQKHSFKLFFLVSLSVLLNDDLCGQVLDQFKAEGLESIGLGSLTEEGAEKFVSIVVGSVEFGEGALGILNLRD